jgi:hypothetical protein
MPQQQFRKPHLCSIILRVALPHTNTSFNLIAICLNVVQRCSYLCNVHMFRRITHCKCRSLFRRFLRVEIAAVTANAWLINIDWSKPMNQANESCIKQEINDMSNICNVSMPSLCIEALQRACRHVLLVTVRAFNIPSFAPPARITYCIERFDALTI